MTSLDESAARSFLRALFPGGLKDSRLWEELCPDGWPDSPLFVCFHPPPEMAYEEYEEYMGTIWVGRRADLTPLYRMIFLRLKACGADWRYGFPRLRMFSAEEIAEHAGVPYEPAATEADEIERAVRENELGRMRKKLERANLAAQREARRNPPPPTVQAYQEVYGGFPYGWPPDPYEPG